MRWRLSNLLGEYQATTGERLSYQDVADGSGISKTTVYSIANGRTQRVDLPTLSALIGFFNERGMNIGTGDLLEWVPEQGRRQ